MFLRHFPSQVPNIFDSFHYGAQRCRRPEAGNKGFFHSRIWLRGVDDKPHTFTVSVVALQRRIDKVTVAQLARSVCNDIEGGSVC